ncbi:hypothetical protein LCGC14_1628040, partial [marine sediment metagenome]
ASFYDPATMTESEPVSITPLPRKKTISVTGREYRRNLGGTVATLTSPALMKAEVAKIERDGVLLLNNQHQPVGFHPISPGAMSKLRGGEEEGSSGLFRAIHRTNAAAFVPVYQNADNADFQNITNFLSTTGRVLDVMVRQPDGGYSSYTEAGLFTGANTGIFLSLAADSETAFTLRAAQRAISKPLSQISDTLGIDVQVIHSDAIPDAVKAQIPAGKRPKGFVQGNTVYLVHNHLSDAQDAQIALAHELKGHVGVQLIIGGENWAKTLDQYRNVKELGGERFNSILDEVRQRYGEVDEATEIKEFIAIAAERGEKTGAVRRFMRTIRRYFNQGLRALGFTRPIGMSDIDVILARSERVLRESVPEYRAEGAPTLAMEEEERTQADAKGLPMDKESRMERAREMGFDTDRLWFHGSATPGITAFDPSKAGSVQTSDWGPGIYFSPSRGDAKHYAAEAVLRTKDPEGDRLYSEYENKAKDLGTRPMFEGIDLGFQSQKYNELKVYYNRFAEHREQVRKTSPGTVYPVYLKTEKPMIYQYVGITDPYLPMQAMAEGHDSIFIVHERDSDESFEDTIEEVLVFDPEQVRSTDAAFDPEYQASPDLLASLEEVPQFSLKDQVTEPTGQERRGPEAAGPMPGRPRRFKFSNARTEMRFREAKAGVGDQRSIGERVKDGLEHTMRGFSRRHIDLPNEATFALANEALRQYEAAPQAAKEEVIRELTAITEGLSREEYDIFTRKVIMDDLTYEVELVHELPFGFTPEELEMDKTDVDDIVARNVKLQDALERRQAIQEVMRAQLIAKGILGEEANNPAYFRHQVLTYARARQLAQGAGKLKTPKPGYAKKRHGSLEDINANYLEAEFEYLHRALIDIKAVETIQKIGRDYDLSRDLKDQAKELAEEKGELVDWHDLVPEGYRTWQPDKGNLFYTGLTVPERMVDKLLEEAAMSDLLGKDVDTDALKQVILSIRKAVMMGGKKFEMVLPEEIADTLDRMRPEVDDSIYAFVLEKPQTLWKRWTLISPRRVLKYNINNISGDLDAVIAGNPQVVKKLPEAMKELWAVMKSGKPIIGYRLHGRRYKTVEPSVRY